MIVNSQIQKHMSVPDHSDPQRKVFDLELAKTLFVGTAAFVAPAAVSINWGISQLLSVSQFFFYRAKLKKFDGLDLDEIRQKDSELRIRMAENGGGGQQLLSATEPEIQFEFDQQTGNVKAKQLGDNKNETQRNFLKVYGKANK